MEKNLSFDAALQRIEEIAALLEKGTVGFEESEKLVHEAQELHQWCMNQLRIASEGEEQS